MSSWPGEWRAELPATLEAIERFFMEFRIWRADVCAELNAFSAELLLREVLTNSVVHASVADPNKHIWCVLRPKRGRILIGIKDEGEGFDWRGLWQRRSDISDTHGRGIEILREHASLVRFNPKGNVVTLVKRF